MHIIKDIHISLIIYLNIKAPPNCKYFTILIIQATLLNINMVMLFQLKIIYILLYLILIVKMMILIQY